MEKYVKRMIEEHKDLLHKIDNLLKYQEEIGVAKDNKFEFALKERQRVAMQEYELVLKMRLELSGVVFNEITGEYLVVVDNCNQAPTTHAKGSDFDVDKKSVED